MYMMIADHTCRRKQRMKPELKNDAFVRKSVIYDRILWFLTAALMISFVVLERYTWCSYVYIGILAASVAVFLLQNGIHIGFSFEKFHLFTSLFALYCLISMIWAPDRGLTMTIFKSILKSLITMWFFYLHYQKKTDVRELINIIFIAGAVIAAYAIYRYGFQRIWKVLTVGKRLKNNFTNRNTIGVMSAITLVIAFSRLINKKPSWFLLLALPCIPMAIATGSKKTSAILAVGFIMLVLIRVIRKSPDRRKTFIRIICVLIMTVVIGYIIVSLPIMKSLVKPVTHLLNYFTGDGKSDKSTTRRMNYIDLGYEQFLKTPLWGIGVGNSPLIIGADTYLHANYIELLACGGIIGFLVYYAPYIYLIKKSIELRRIEQNESDLCFVLIILVLVTDIGQVTYYSKETYFYLMMFFLHIKNLQRLASQKGDVDLYA